MIDWRHYFSGGYYLFASIDSTQNFIHQQAASAAPVFCRAHQQSGGYGQRQAHWQSPAGQLYCSFRVAFDLPSSAFAGLTQYVALTLAQSLDPEQTFLRLKWPNDIFTDQGKCGGILLESQSWRKHTLLTIGIGLNLTQDAAFANLSDSLGHINAEDALDRFMPELIAALARWQQTPYLPINHAWNDYDRYHQQAISLDNGETGTALGIDQRGALIMRQGSDIAFHTQVRIRS
ncbi:biotin--[acetyl-CoA-carboxylase] ligase [Suttonella sp. R2A3]|uniref:biotin--[acetyl-CoA-carboxylase] ligase n=1 Tax=Suttonella sp. R2A3 TaxID=2908648 RepID=UPI001F2D70DC|nr:biotin--[acetyl-CoA-carboxylase] ligase [Suttonella sp. R2A3]UJF25138.1 biotin--[acetyl-CoA-carboxylase] ligase [Suttonella sp. R2A3]